MIEIIFWPRIDLTRTDLTLGVRAIFCHFKRSGSHNMLLSFESIVQVGLQFL